ncbi:MAG: DUF4352 domain-containing protein [Nanoarchaeota archaeon]
MKQESWFERHKILGTILIIVGTIIVMSIIVGLIMPKENPGSSNEEQTVYGLNEKVIVGNFAYKFSNLRKQYEIGNDHFGDKANGIFLIFDVEVENIGNQAEYINDKIYIIDNQGREFAQDDGAWIYLKDNLVFEKLNPGLTKKGQIIFDVPANIEGKIGIKKNMWSSDYAVFISWT